MTREEALKLLKTDRLSSCEAEADRFCEAYDMAINALENHDTFMKYAYSQGKQDALSQEPCEDAVSREAVKEWFCQLNCGRMTCNCAEPCEDYKSIADLPSVTQKSGNWISVSKRLPENSGNYLITYYLEDKRETQEAVYIEEKDKWFDITDIEITLAVIAWMPLPKPYKEGESE